MKKLLLSAFMITAFGVLSNAQTPQTPQTQPTQKTQPSHNKKMQHNRMGSDTTKANKDWGTNKKMKSKSRRGADSTGVK